MLILWFSGTSEARERAIGTEKHQFAANSAEMAAITVRPCFRPRCSAGQAAQREASPLEKSAPFQNHSRIAARKGLTSPNPLHKLPGRS
jgi:hypothetical protein